jgi:hypothetical protein
MIAQYGMEVFPKFFRRAVQLNADYIFSNSSQTPQGSYDLLSKYVQKIKLDPQEADNVAESIDTTEGDLFKNFDVSKFMDHFKLDAIAKSMLALSLKNASKPDLRTKGESLPLPCRFVFGSPALSPLHGSLFSVKRGLATTLTSHLLHVTSLPSNFLMVPSNFHIWNPSSPTPSQIRLSLTPLR